MGASLMSHFIKGRPDEAVNSCGDSRVKGRIRTTAEDEILDSYGDRAFLYMSHVDLDFSSSRYRCVTGRRHVRQVHFSRSGRAALTTKRCRNLFAEYQISNIQSLRFRHFALQLTDASPIDIHTAGYLVVILSYSHITSLRCHPARHGIRYSTIDGESTYPHNPHAR